MMFVLRMAWRETRAAWIRLVFFFVCVAIGVAAIIVLRSVVQNVRQTLTREARQIVGAEDPAKPLSDSQISAMLEEQGIHVARRTVAKYREALKIAPTQLRKAM